MGKNIAARIRRKKRIRGRVTGQPERPRLTVFRSAKHIYAQVVDDLSGTTLATSSTLTKELRGNAGSKTDEAKGVGQALAKACLEKNVDKVVFDRNGYRYHGRLKALADAAREAGLKF